MNNTANALLAIGASPVMAHSLEEVNEMASIASAVVLNIGTLEPAWVEAMLLAGHTARSNGKPVVFDPVGEGATTYRKTVCREIIKEVKPQIIRGNASEIISLCNEQGGTKGVDSTASSDSAVESAKALALETDAIVVISGETDYITDGKMIRCVYNGHPMMARVTGMGCTATAVVAAFAAVNTDFVEASTHAMSIMGLAGEIAVGYSKGTGTLQVHFLDQLCTLDEAIIAKYLK